MIDGSPQSAPQSGAFVAADDRWSFGGSLTLDAAAGVLQASQALPLPSTGVVDFSGMMQGDSSALAVMLALKRRAHAEGRTLTLTGLPASLRSLAIVYGVEHYLADAEP